LIAHVVLFNERQGLSAEQLGSFARILQATLKGVPAITRATVGRSVEVDAGYAREFGDKTYRFAAVIEFRDIEGLQAYLQHPLHHELGRLFWEYCESTIVLELETIDALREDLTRMIRPGT